MPHAASDIAPDDELKVFHTEGSAADEELCSVENLKEVKTSLVTEVTEAEEKHHKNASDFLPPKSPRRSYEALGPHVPGKQIEYISPSPYGYVMSPYHPHPNAPYGALSMVNRVPLVPPNHSPSIPFMMYNAEQFQPPPAHMGISHLNHKTGMGRAPVYPLPPPNQFHPPMFSPELTQFWHPTMYSMSPGFRSPHYPSSLALPSPANLQGKFSPHPGFMHPGIPTSMGHIPFMGPGPKMEASDSQDSRPFPNFSHHSPHASPSLSHSQAQNVNHRTESAPRSHHSKKSHIKKPLNAFMLFMKEQRPQVVRECTLKESAAINQILGKRWQSLRKEEQAKYYEMARVEREVHQAKYPGWTARENYAINAKKKKRKRDKSQEGADGNSPKKCRARFGLDHMQKWCKPCRRKKKCVAFRNGSDPAGDESENNIGSVESMGSLEAPTPDSHYSADTDDDDDDSDSVSRDLESSEFSLSSPAVPLGSVSSPITVPRLSESVQSLNGESHHAPLSVLHLTGHHHHRTEEGEMTHVTLPTPPSTDSSATSTAST